MWRTLAAYAGALDLDEVPSLEEVAADLGLSTPSAGDLTRILSSDNKFEWKSVISRLTVRAANIGVLLHADLGAQLAQHRRAAVCHAQRLSRNHCA